MGETKVVKPAIEGWWTPGDTPQLIGSRCRGCGVYVFPRAQGHCPNPGCDSDDFEDTPLSPRGHLWSYTNACYQPPAPYVPHEPYVPFCIAAVALETEALVVLGQVADGFTVADLEVGMSMNLVVQTLFEDDGHAYQVWRWRPQGGTEGVRDG